VLRGKPARSLDPPCARRGGAGRASRAVLRIYDDMLDALRTMRKVVATIEKRDSDLARQLRRAASSVVLNVGEGSGSSGGNRTARYRTALGSARETLACLRVTEACGYVDSVPGAILDSLNRVVGTLVRVAA
jgi:four helix bundle protein